MWLQVGLPVTSWVPLLGGSLPKCIWAWLLSQLVPGVGRLLRVLRTPMVLSVMVGVSERLGDPTLVRLTKLGVFLVLLTMKLFALIPVWIFVKPWTDLSKWTPGMSWCVVVSMKVSLVVA